MRMILISAAALVLAGAAPAHAADVANLGCVEAGVTAPTVTALHDSAVGLLDGTSSEPPADAKAALQASAGQCAGRFQWNDAARDAAMTFALAKIGIDGLIPVAEKRGVKLAQIESALADLTADQRAGVLRQDRDSIATFLQKLAGHGVQVTDTSTAQVVGVFAAFVLLRDKHRAIFAGA